jgi:hypothetical protein
MRTAIHVAWALVLFATSAKAQGNLNHAAGSKAPVPANSASLGRKGLWVSAGLGAATAKLHCAVCAKDQPSKGTSAYARVGTTLSPFFLVGLEANGWLRNDDEANHHIVAITGNAYWYPNLRHGYFVKAGFGFSNYRQSKKRDNSDVTDALLADGFTGQVGVGYEVRVNPRTSIVPYVNVIGSANGTLSAQTDDGSRLERNRLRQDVNIVMLQVGMGVTWH